MNFGPYRLLRVLGEGASGRVWLAHDPVADREIALKIVRSPRLGEDFQHRFKREIRLLGALEHPGIARLYAAGAVEHEQAEVPFLAMEYVRGQDLRRHAKAQALGKDACLALIAATARAVHHAHTRGIVHRDLKPENIIVDEAGQPRVVDFGVAYVLGGDEMTRMTMTGEILGTLAYMAPEQLSGTVEADPRMDVHALGVIAYELLSGQTPHPDIGEQSLPAAILTLSRLPPPPLSRRLPAARGDIETIVMKAMASDPAQRYGSAAELAADIERYLARQPIAARPPSIRHASVLFMRRHRALAFGLGVAVLGLLMATLASSWFAWSESRARQEAELRLAEREAISEFLQDMLTAADPGRALGERLTVIDVLDIARVKLEQSDALPAAVAAQLQRTLGNTYSSLGRGDLGLAALAQAEHLQFAAAVDWQLALALDRAAALAAAGREAESLDMARSLIQRLERDDRQYPALLAEARLHEATLLDQRGHLEPAEQILRALLDEAGLASSLSGDMKLKVQGRLAMTLHKQGRYDPSIELARAVAEETETRFGPWHPRTLEALEVIAVSLRDLGAYSEAESIYRRTLAARQQVLGDDHPLTHQTRGGLAAVLAFDGQVDSAWDQIERGYRRLVEQLGLEAEAVRIMGNLYAHVASQRGDHAEAIRVLQLLVAQNEAMPGGPSATDLADYNNLAFNLMQAGRCDEALPVQRRLLALATDALGDSHLHTALFRVNFASCLERGGDTAEASAALRLAVPVLVETLGPDHPRSVSAGDQLDQLDQRIGSL